VLLETGNWTDSSHPTGRRVTFTNSFAVEGHYFNFSTSGQWLWDELQIVLPAGKNPYPVVEAIQKIVLEATSEGARLAEQEWKSAAKYREVKVSAAPAINVKPIIGGAKFPCVMLLARTSDLYCMPSLTMPRWICLARCPGWELPPSPIPIHRSLRSPQSDDRMLS
jgi:hypothetical protein